ncbi:PE family protein, partial [Mycobacterium marinum]
MSGVMVVPETLLAAAAELGAVGSAVCAADAAVLVPTVRVSAAGADEVSVAIAVFFSSYGNDYQSVSAQLAEFHERFVQALSSGGGAYGAAEAASASPLQQASQSLLAQINAPTQALLGRPLIGDGADGTAPGQAGGDGGLLYGNGGAGGLAEPV